MHNIELEINSKNQQIKELKSTVQKQSELIKFDEIVIDKLTDKINNLHNIIGNAKQIIGNLREKIGELQQSMYQLNDRLTKQENENVFQRAFQRVKGMFSRTPKLPSASGECRDIYEKSFSLWKKTDKEALQMEQYNEKNNIVEMNNLLRQRQDMKRGDRGSKRNPNTVEFYFDRDDSLELDSNGMPKINSHNDSSGDPRWE